MKIIYVAHPYRANSIWQQHQNILSATRITRDVIAAGMGAYNPLGNTGLMDGPDIPDERFLEMGLAMLKRCDGILLCKGWSKSAGCNGERNEAMRIGLPVFYLPDGGELPEALFGWRDERQKRFMVIEGPPGKRELTRLCNSTEAFALVRNAGDEMVVPLYEGEEGA